MAPHLSIKVPIHMRYGWRHLQQGWLPASFFAQRPSNEGDWLIYQQKLDTVKGLKLLYVGKKKGKYLAVTSSGNCSGIQEGTSGVSLKKRSPKRMNIPPLTVDGKRSGFLLGPPCFQCTNSATVDAQNHPAKERRSICRCTTGDMLCLQILHAFCIQAKLYTSYLHCVPHVRTGTRTIYLLTFGKRAIPLSTVHPSIHHPPGTFSRETKGHGREAMWILRKAGGPNSPCFQPKKGGKSLCKFSIAIEIHDIQLQMFYSNFRWEQSGFPLLCLDYCKVVSMTQALLLRKVSR